MNADTLQRYKHLNDAMMDMELSRKRFKDVKEYTYKVWWKAKIQAMIYIDRGAK
jgi:hypothetical protein